MDELKRVFVTLLLSVVTGYVCATETEDPGLLFSHPVLQQLSARLEALVEQSKVQQDRISELEARDLAQQKQNGIQQEIISSLEAAVRNQQQQIDGLSRTLSETNHVCNNLHDIILTTQNEETTDREIEENTEDSTTDDNRIRARRQQPEVKNIALTVILAHPLNDLGLNQNVVFDKVETNIGNGYNPHHGVFTAPVAGTYVFHVTVFGQHNAEIWCKIVVNGVNKADAYARGGADHHDQGSQTLVVRLNQGDDVAIQNGRAYDNVFGGPNLWTTFSGFLLRSDADVTTILG